MVNPFSGVTCSEVWLKGKPQAIERYEVVTVSSQAKGLDGNIKESKHQTAWKDHIYILSIWNMDR